MGIWGTGPFDNDYAGDMVAKLMRPIEKVLELPLSAPFKLRRRQRRSRSKPRVKRGVMIRRIYSKPIASDHYIEARASAAIILLAHGTDILGGPRLQSVLDALKKMRSDKEWLETWNQKPGSAGPWWRKSSSRAESVEKALDKQIRAVQRKVRLCCRKKRIKSIRRRGRVLCKRV